MRSRPATLPIKAPRASAARADARGPLPGNSLDGALQGRGAERVEWPRPLVAMSLLVAALFVASCQVAAPAEPLPPASDIATQFEEVKRSPPKLRAFLRAMPKGADLHSHLGGAIYAESYLGWAEEDDLCVDVSRLVLVTCDTDALSLCGEGRPPPPLCHREEDLARVAHATRDRTFRGRLIDALSTRNYGLYERSGHDQFFTTFGALGPAGQGRGANILAEAMRRAAGQNILYLELMASPGMGAASGLVADMEWNDDLGTMRGALADSDLDAIVAGSSAYLADMEARARELMRCDSESPEGACAVTVRFLAQAIRTRPAAQVFAQMVFGFRLAAADPRVVGVNLVAPEDDPISLADYSRHMRAVAFASAEAPDAGVALHAGELALGLVPPEELTFHIREAVEIAGANRIGHGTDVMHEDNPYQLLTRMRERNVAVEIILTSSDVILGITGADHPLPIYLEHGVPVVIATDDEGVSRTDLTHEYQRAVATYDLDYATVKRLSHASLEHSFLPAREKQALLDELSRRFAKFETKEVARGGE